MKNRLPKYGSSRRAALDFLAKLSFEQIDEGIDSRRSGPGEAARVSTQGEPPVRRPVRESGASVDALDSSANGRHLD